MLIKSTQEGGEHKLTAVIADFGLAAPIPHEKLVHCWIFVKEAFWRTVLCLFLIFFYVYLILFFRGNWRSFFMVYVPGADWQQLVPLSHWGSGPPALVISCMLTQLWAPWWPRPSVHSWLPDCSVCPWYVLIWVMMCTWL